MRELGMKHCMYSRSTNYLTVLILLITLLASNSSSCVSPKGTKPRPVKIANKKRIAAKKVIKKSKKPTVKPIKKVPRPVKVKKPIKAKVPTRKKKIIKTAKKAPKIVPRKKTKPGARTVPKRVVKNVPKVIKFYHAHKPYYQFTNFFHAPIVVDGKKWLTSEHYFQSQKFDDDDLKEQVRLQQTARYAFDQAHSLDSYKRWDWDAIKDDAMLQAIWAKFNQHPRLRKLLLDTDDSTLVEATQGKDIYWGVDQHGFGFNRLGQSLMLIRSELRKGRSPERPPSANELPIAQKKKWF